MRHGLFRLKTTIILYVPRVFLLLNDGHRGAGDGHAPDADTPRHCTGSDRESASVSVHTLLSGGADQSAAARPRLLSVGGIGSISPVLLAVTEAWTTHRVALRSLLSPPPLFGLSPYVFQRLPNVRLQRRIDGNPILAQLLFKRTCAQFSPPFPQPKAGTAIERMPKSRTLRTRSRRPCSM